MKKEEIKELSNKEIKEMLDEISVGLDDIEIILDLIDSRLDGFEKENTTTENSDVNGNIKRGHKISRAPNGMSKK